MANTSEIIFLVNAIPNLSDKDPRWREDRHSHALYYKAAALEAFPIRTAPTDSQDVLEPTGGKKTVTWEGDLWEVTFKSSPESRFNIVIFPNGHNYQISGAAYAKRESRNRVFPIYPCKRYEKGNTPFYVHESTGYKYSCPYYFTLGDGPVKGLSMEKLDEKPSDKTALQTQVATLTSDMTALQTQVATLTSDKTALQTQVDTLTGDKTALKTQVDTLTGDKTALQTQVDTLKNDKVELQAQIDTLTGDKTTLQTQVDTLKNDKVELQAQIDTLTGDKTALQTQIDTLTGDKTALQTQIDTLKNDKAELQAQIDILRRAETELQAALKAAKQTKISNVYPNDGGDEDNTAAE